MMPDNSFHISILKIVFEISKGFAKLVITDNTYETDTYSTQF